MSLVSSFTIALVAISGLLVLLTAATAVRKALRAGAERRRARLEAVVRPALLRLLADDDPSPLALEVTSRAAGRSLEELAAGLLTKLRGEDRRVLTTLLQEHGTIQRARRRTHRRGPVGRARAAELLGATADSSSLPDLVRLLSDRDPDVRAAAARALGKLGDAEAVPALLRALEGRRAVPAGVVTMSLLHLGPSAAPALAAQLGRSGSPLMRAVAAELLGRLGEFASTDELIGRLRADDDSEVRAAAARALGRIGMPRAAAALEAALIEDDSAAVKRACAWALGELGALRGLAGLAAALRSGDHALARHAAEALVACGTSGRALLERTAASGAPGAAEARETLGRAEAVAR